MFVYKTNVNADSFEYSFIGMMRS